MGAGSPGHFDPTPSPHLATATRVSSRLTQRASAPTAGRSAARKGMGGDCRLGRVTGRRLSGSPPRLPTPFSADSTRAVMREACDAAGLDPDGALLMRLGENALYRLHGKPIVVRIARTMDYWDDACKEVAVANWLLSHRFPAVSLAGPVSQPIEIAGHPVTFWRYIDGRVAARHEINVLGELLRRLHALPPPASFRLPALDILDRVEARVEIASVPTSDQNFLLDRLNDLRVRVAALSWQLKPTAIHGDAHDHNVMFENGQPLLIDFERFAWGQPEWDLAVTATEYLTGGWWTRDEYAAFATAYGFDVTEWDGFDVLLATNELKMTTWIMQNINESPEIADEYANRMQTLRTGKPLRPWRAF
jgi:Ser/Thr protein kinase RdoA (MazF antagonist)